MFSSKNKVLRAGASMHCSVTLVLSFFVLGTLPGVAAPVKDESAVTLRKEMDKHPALLESEYRHESLTHGAKARARFPDPELEFSRMTGRVMERAVYPELSYSDVSAESTEVRFRQPIPLPGRLTLARRAAEGEAKAAALDVMGTRNALTGGLLNRLSSIHENRKVLEMTVQFERRLRILAETTRARYETGRGSLSDTTRAMVLAGRYSEQSLRLKGAIESLQNELAYFIRLESREFWSSDSPPVNVSQYAQYLRVRIPGSGNDPGAQEAIIQRSLKVRTARNLEEGWSATKDLMLLDYAPDFSVFGAISEGNMNAAYPPTASGKEKYYSVGLSLRLPIWSAFENGASVKEASFGSQAATSRIQVERESFLSEFRSLSRSLATLEQRLERYRGDLIPKATLSRDSASVSYEAGRVGFTDLLDTWRDLYALETERLTLEGERERIIFSIAVLMDLFYPDGTSEGKEQNEATQ